MQKPKFKYTIYVMARSEDGKKCTHITHGVYDSIQECLKVSESKKFIDKAKELIDLFNYEVQNGSKFVVDLILPVPLFDEVSLSLYLAQKPKESRIFDVD